MGPQLCRFPLCLLYTTHRHNSSALQKAELHQGHIKNFPDEARSKWAACCNGEEVNKSWWIFNQGTIMCFCCTVCMCTFLHIRVSCFSNFNGSRCSCSSPHSNKNLWVLDLCAYIGVWMLLWNNFKSFPDSRPLPTLPGFARGDGGKTELTAKLPLLGDYDYF